MVSDGVAIFEVLIYIFIVYLILLVFCNNSPFRVHNLILIKLLCEKMVSNGTAIFEVLIYLLGEM